MNLADLQTKLLAAARTDVPGDQVPYAFEKRVAALIASRPAPGNPAFWVSGLWRAAVSCLAVTLLLGAWAAYHPAATVATTEDLPQNFENTLLASVDPSDQAQ